MGTRMLQFARSTPAIEAGFLAAGLTVSIGVAVQALLAIMLWI